MLKSESEVEECKKYYQLTIDGAEEAVVMPSFARISSDFIFEFGAGGVTMKYLLGTILRGPKARVVCERLANGIEINQLMNMTEKDFLRIEGIGPITASQLAATFEIAKRLQLIDRTKT
ncbi:hypothetical protein POF51_29535 [Brevibacillus sp. AG]|uniref:hypothetical protein n=1 Tax=Brevibacillus sp. AG TaxID=3020891 RepID=UPI00232C13CE|nr:hypothetical protein [Brevibacillus sp. AG]MDC0764867.1 hypothetical protein [Brevibacillus sp. AG]